ncbi:MAG: hypothetical protein IKX53_06630 [Bacteroidales bacterium]|nr:hypothetical protein [Bacteroidales bacterium]
MKNIFSFAIAAMAGLLLVSCEPVLIEGPKADAPISVSELQSAFVIDGQYEDAACTVPQSNGNYIKYHTSPARTVQVYNFKADGSKNILATGASGVFLIKPRRGADSNQPFAVATINQDASIISFESMVNVHVPADLDPAVKVLTGESGAKAWKWYTLPSAGVDACWGNCGYIGVGGQANVAAGEVPGCWWGAAPSQLETEQIAHTGGTIYGYGDDNAYMVFNEDMECISYKADGSVIAKGSYSLNDYDPECSNGYLYGKLVTEGAPILMPFRINSGGTRVNEFEVIYIDPNMMTLIDRNGNEEWGWSESTWWRFKNASDPDAALAGSGTRAWTYYTLPSAGVDAAWGNCGYIGVGGQANVAAGEVPGCWWGCPPADMETSQIQHAGGVAYGYGSDDAYMVFDVINGTVTSYNASGSAIASSSYAVENFDWQGDYKMGDLTTGADPGILFPFRINAGGEKVTNYEILYLDGQLLTLIDRNGNEEWGWSESTWWRFQPKR